MFLQNRARLSGHVKFHLLTLPRIERHLRRLSFPLLPPLPLPHFAGLRRPLHRRQNCRGTWQRSCQRYRDADANGKPRKWHYGEVPAHFIREW